MKLIPNESWDNELLEITEILCILSKAWNLKNLNFLMFQIFWGKFLNEIFTSKKILQLL